MKSVPSHCPRCCEGLVDTPEGRVPNFYGRLVFPADPPDQSCPNCGSVLVSVMAQEMKQHTERLIDLGKRLPVVSELTSEASDVAA